MTNVHNKGKGDGSIWSTGTGSAFPHLSAFSAVSDDGSVVSWGNPDDGASQSIWIQDDLSSGVVAVYTNSRTFAALRDDGSVVAWGQGNRVWN